MQSPQYDVLRALRFWNGSYVLFCLPNKNHPAPQSEPSMIADGTLIKPLYYCDVALQNIIQQEKASVYYSIA
jgi:hypothetical protein